MATHGSILLTAHLCNEQGQVILGALNRLRSMANQSPYDGSAFQCTGSFTALGLAVRCLSPFHSAPTFIRAIPAPILSSEINALPDRVRYYIHDLETRMDPSGDVQTIASLTEQRDGLVLVVADLRAQLAEAEATLLNERGEGEPPEPGWVARPRGDLVRWVRYSARPGRTLDVVRQGADEPGRVVCHWWDREIDKDGEVTETHAEGYAPTFRAAMREASAKTADRAP